MSKGNSLKKQNQTLPINEHKVITRTVQSTFIGPVPDPLTLGQYGDLDSSFPERFIRMAEIEQKARHEYDLKALESDSKLDKIGVYGTLVIILMCFIFSGFLFYIGQSGWGISAVFLGIGGLIGATILGKNKNSTAEAMESLKKLKDNDKTDG